MFDLFFFQLIHARGTNFLIKKNKFTYFTTSIIYMEVIRICKEIKSNCLGEIEILFLFYWKKKLHPIFIIRGLIVFLLLFGKV